MEEKALRNDYDFGEVDGRILLELSISLDQFKTETVRQTTDILSMIGDVGGFMGAFTMLISVVGAFFSDLYFKASITENFYIRALSSKELKDRKVERVNDLKGMFKLIKFNAILLILDPIICFFARFGICKRLSCRKRT